MHGRVSEILSRAGLRSLRGQLSPAAKAASIGLLLAVLAGFGLTAFLFMRDGDSEGVDLREATVSDSEGIDLPEAAASDNEGVALREAAAFVAVAFVDPDHGWAIETLADDETHLSNAGSTILATEDGGHTWTQQFSTSISLDTLEFVSTQHGWAAGRSGSEGGLYHTTDGGKTWVELIRDADFRLVSLNFITPEVGWISTADGALQTTSDGGHVWARIASPCDEHWRALISLVAPDTGWVLCLNGTGAGFMGKILYRTNDGGLTWEELSNASGPPETVKGDLSTGGYVADMFFLDESTGWLIYDRFPIASILITQDGGETWERVLLPTGNDKDAFAMSNFHFIDRQHGWVVGAFGNLPGQIYSTSDGGQTWTIWP